MENQESVVPAFSQPNPPSYSREYRDMDEVYQAGQNFFDCLMQFADLPPQPDCPSFPRDHKTMEEVERAGETFFECLMQFADHPDGR